MLRYENRLRSKSGQITEGPMQACFSCFFASGVVMPERSDGFY